MPCAGKWVLGVNQGHRLCGNPVKLDLHFINCEYEQGSLFSIPAIYSLSEFEAIWLMIQAFSLNLSIHSCHFWLSSALQALTAHNPWTLF